MDISKLKVVDLKKELKTRGLSTIGTKNELMERLQDAVQDDDNGDSGALDNDDLLDEEAVLADEEAILEEGNANLITQEDDAVLLTPTTLSAPKVTVEKTIQNSKNEIVSAHKKIILNRKVVTSPSDSGMVSQEVDNHHDANKSDESDSKEEKKVVKLGSLSAEERAKLRAQKFGVPVPDSVKKAVRAERFGSTNSTESTTSKSQVPDNDKLLKRQARFGVISNSNTEVDEKKQKRAERFGTTSTAVGSSDEQKRKRAERFGLA